MKIDNLTAEDFQFSFDQYRYASKAIAEKYKQEQLGKTMNVETNNDNTLIKVTEVVAVPEDQKPVEAIDPVI